jgi:hypothetical protein
MVRLVAGLAIAGAILFQLWADREIRHPPGQQLAPHPPIQKDLQNAEAIVKDGYRITPLAQFEVEARVLSAERYWLGREADLAPVDLALGWGPMSDQSVLDQIEIWQSSRFYFWKSNQLPIPANEISEHSANMHLIPANKYVDRQLKSARAGNVVRFTGYLVQIEAGDGWRWRSSMTRADTGNGACEVVLVEDVSVI